MIEHPFTRQELARCVTARDILRKKSLSDATEREKLSNSAVQLLGSPSPFDGTLKKVSLRGKTLIQFQGLDAELISRLVARNIRSNCHVQQSNRRVIVRNLVSLLKEGCPYNLYRFDIENFFENIDRKAIVGRLLSEMRVPRQAIIILNRLFNELDKLGVSGVPRGLGVSSVLAEYVLEQFDAAMRSHSDIFFYARFVDDMVFVTSNQITKKFINDFIAENLPKPLQVHTRGGKVAALSVGGISEKELPPHFFEYLGYSFKIHSTATKGFLDVNARRLDVEISQEKLEKIKSRLISSFTAYLCSAQMPNDYRLLKDRVRALSGNYEIEDPTKKIGIKTGIYYNYAEKNVFGDCALEKLDGLCRGLLFSKSHPLSQRVQAVLTLAQRRELAGYSFVQGYQQRRFHSFKYKGLKEIKGVWRK